MRLRDPTPREMRAARPGSGGGRPLCSGTTWCSSKKPNLLHCRAVWEAGTYFVLGLRCTHGWRGWDFPAGRHLTLVDWVGGLMSAALLR